MHDREPAQSAPPELDDFAAGGARATGALGRLRHAAAVPTDWLRASAFGRLADAAFTMPRDASLTRGANNFDALRLAAALLVVYGHNGVDATGTFGLRLVVFFAISGFLVSGSWFSDPHPLRFMLRRFLRVWPAYAVVIVACAAISYVFPARDMPEISRMASVFYLSNLWFAGVDWGFFAARDPFMNQSIWMMRYEVDLYIALALIAMLGRRAMRVVAAVVLVASFGAAETHPGSGGLLECWSLYFGGFFSFGVLLREFPSLRRGRVVLCFVAAGIALLAFGLRTAGLLLFIPPAAVWIGEQSWPVVRRASRFGDLSLGIFLWAWPVHQVTALWIEPTTPAAIKLAVVVIQVVVLAWASWHFIEAPMLRRKPARPMAKKGRERLADAAL